MGYYNFTSFAIEGTAEELGSLKASLDSFLVANGHGDLNALRASLGDGAPNHRAYADYGDVKLLDGVLYFRSLAKYETSSNIADLICGRWPSLRVFWSYWDEVDAECDSAYIGDTNDEDGRHFVAVSGRIVYRLPIYPLPAC